MKKLLMLAALGLVFQAAPVLAGHHEEGDKKRGFEAVDTNNDGIVTKSEFLAHSEKKFAEKDTDGNGEISKEEAAEHRASKKEKMKEMREKMKEKRQERKAE